MKLPTEPTKEQVEAWVRRVRADAKRLLAEVESDLWHAKLGGIADSLRCDLRTMVGDANDLLDDHADCDDGDCERCNPDEAVTPYSPRRQPVSAE